MDNDFHNIGIGIIRHNVFRAGTPGGAAHQVGRYGGHRSRRHSDGHSALGRFLITKKESDIASFKTPGLRNVLVTGPYFHDGSQVTLWDAMDHYNKGDGFAKILADEDIQPLALTEKEIDDVVAFLASLTSDDYKKQGLESWRASARFRERRGRSAIRRGHLARNQSSQSHLLLNSPDVISEIRKTGLPLSR